MTVNLTHKSKVWTGDGATAPTTALTWDGMLFSATELVIVAVHTTTGIVTALAKDTHYTVDPLSAPYEAATVRPIDIEVPNVFTSSYKWVAIRLSSDQQTHDVTATATIQRASLESQLDRLTCRVQELEETIERCLKFPASERALKSGFSGASHATLPARVSRVSLDLKFDSNGDMTVA